MSFTLTAALLLSTALPFSTADAKKKAPTLNVKKANLEIGKKKSIKVKNTSKKVKWSVKSGKKFINLSKKKKNSVVVTGQKVGKATVLANVAGKKLTCKITVKKKNIAETTPTPIATATATAPAATGTPLASQTPAAEITPTPTPEVTPNPAFEPSGYRYDGLDTLWITKNIDPTKPVVAMSFDDGPGTYGGYVEYGTQIQEALKEAGAHATFFYIGSHIEHDAESRQEVENAWKAGFEVANHSYDSIGLNINKADMIKEKIAKTDALLTEITGYTHFLFRAPNVAYNDTMFEVIDKPFIDVSIWSNDYQENVDKDAIVKNVTSKLADGGIINMHSVHEKTAQAVPEILAYCKENGFQVVSVSELFAIKGKALEAGVKYNSAN